MIGFQEPLWLWIGLGLIPAGLLLLRWLEKKANHRLARFADSRLLAQLTAGFSRRGAWTRNILFLSALCLLFAALARPYWGFRYEEAAVEGIDLLIALALSKSMQAEDVAPNRLERSKLAILDLLEEMRGDRVGLIGFAGKAFLQCPLTLDQSAFRQTLEAMDAGTIPSPGTDIAAAIREATGYFEVEDNHRILVLMTDGEDLEASGIAAAREAAEAGVRIFTVGVGSQEGSLIPIRNERGQRDYVRDAQGNPVTSRLDTSTLTSIASATGGSYAPLTAGGNGLLEVYRSGLSDLKKASRQAELQRIPVERFFWPLLGAIGLLLLEPLIRIHRPSTGRAGAAFALLLALLSPPPSEAAPSAIEAQKAFREGDFARSVELYEKAVEASPGDADILFNFGVSLYRNGEYARAVDAYNSALAEAGPGLQAKIFYNQGNAYYRLGESRLESEPALAQDNWKAAIEAYGNARQLEEEAEDIEANHTFVGKELRTHLYPLSIEKLPPSGGEINAPEVLFHRVPGKIEALAADGYVFDRWEGHEFEDPSQARQTVELIEPLALSAHFAKTWELEVKVNDPEMGTAEKSGVYREDEAIGIKADYIEPNAFDRWQAGEGAEIKDPDAAETTVRITQDTEVTAVFVPGFKLEVKLEPEIGGKAGPSGYFPKYDVVPVQAEPRGGFEFEKWEGPWSEPRMEPRTDVALTSDMSITAVMDRIWNLILIPVQEESGKVEGGGNFPVGTVTDIAAIPNEGFEFVRWEGPGVVQPEAAETEVEIQPGDHDLFAIFEQSDSGGNEDQNQEQQNQQNQQDQQGQQNQQNQQNTDQGENQDREKHRSGESSGQKEQNQEQQESGGGEEEESQEETSAGKEPEEETPEGQDEAGPENQPADSSQTESAPLQRVPGRMTQEEARKLLQALEVNEKKLPITEEEGEPANATTRGRDW